jgi:hypothetical protein
MKYLFITIALMFSQIAWPSTFVQSFRNVYSSTNVTTSASLSVIALTSQSFSKMSVFDSSGQTMELLITDPAGTVNTLIIPPGGGGFPVSISKGSTIVLEAVSATASTGEIDINFFN